MAVKQYRKKPVAIEAIQWTGENLTEVARFVGESAKIDFGIGETKLYIKTLEGDHYATPGDYIIKGVQGEFYPCKPDIFQLTYEAVEG